MDHTENFNFIESVTETKNGYLFWKRCLDIVLSVLAFVPLLIISIPVAIAILIEDGYPIFYIQTRVGKDKKEFTLYKFRSMKKNAEEIHEQMKLEYGVDEVSFKLKDEDDPRVLKVGHVIRKFNIDELPQLINIIKGDMSLVGPRPLPKYEADDTDQLYGNKYDLRYRVPQGLTCYWQVADRSEITYEDRMEMDCKYAKEANLWTDVKLVVQTARYAVVGKAEY